MIKEITLPRHGVIRIISDLHLGHPRSKIKSPQDLTPLLEGVEHLIACGDLAETRDCAYQALGLQQRAELATLCHERDIELTILAGNHDPDEPLGIASIDHGRIIALHGHCLYKNVAPWGWEYLHHKAECHQLIAQFPLADTSLADRMELARRMSTLQQPVFHAKRTFTNPVAKFFAHACWPPSRPLAILLAWLSMSRRMHRFTNQFFPTAELVCYGHFHRTCQSTIGHRTYYNVGAFFKDAHPAMLDIHPNGSTTYTPRLRLTHTAQSPPIKILADN